MSRDLSVIRYTELSAPAGQRRQKMAFTLGARSKPVSGVLKLVQMVVKILLTTPGTDHYAPALGTVLPSLVRRGVSRSSEQVIKMDIAISIQDLERQIQEIQASEAIPDDERLRAIHIRQLQYLEASAEWNLEISVESQAGQGVAFDVTPFLKGA